MRRYLIRWRAKTHPDKLRRKSIQAFSKKEAFSKFSDENPDKQVFRIDEICPITKKILVTDWYVYSIRKETDELPSYVGMTGNLPSRVKAHLAGETITHSWIVPLIEQGEMPVFAILGTAPTKLDAQELEKFWFDRFREEGAYLLMSNPSTHEGV